jgi:hypothetical protein
MIYTSGGSALIGLLLVAPMGQTPYQALYGLVDLMGVHDAIYTLLPIGYKTFFKPGPFTRPLYRWGQRFKFGEFPFGPISGVASNRRLDAVRKLYNDWVESWMNVREGSYRRLYNDWIDLWISLMTPTTLNHFSQGMCAPFPFLDDMVDFHKLSLFPGEFYMNAYNLTDQRMEEFSKDQITPAHFRAALAYPSMYPPAEINGKLYSEGADRDPINFGNLIGRENSGGRLDSAAIKTIVLIDIMGSLEPYLVREPRNLREAYGISIMTPVVALARKNLEHFKVHDNKDANGNDIYELLEMRFTIPQSQQAHVMEWGHSNLSHLWTIGYLTGKAFYQDHRDKLPKRDTTAQPPVSPESGLRDVQH